MSRMTALVRCVWPAFLVAAVAEIVVFVAIDPLDLVIFGMPLQHASRTAVCSIGFVLLWCTGYGAAVLALFLAPGVPDEAGPTARAPQNTTATR